MDFLKKLLEAGKITQEEYDEAMAEIEVYKNQVKEARGEAAKRRVKLKELEAQLNKLKSIVQTLGDKFGVDLDEDEKAFEKLKEELEELGKEGKTDLNKLRELEAKLKRLEKEKNEVFTKYEQEANLRKQILIDNAIQKALNEFPVFDKEVVGTYVKQNVTLDDESGEPRFKTKDGVLLDLKEGLKEFFETKPNLLKGQGTPGSGVETGSISSVLKTSTNADDILRAAGIKK